MTESEVIEGCRKGQAAARAELYRLYGGLMYAICRRYVPDPATAEDLLHDGFLAVFTKIGDYRGEGSFEGWCRRVFVTTALGYLRRERRMNHPQEVSSAVGLSSPEASALENISAGDLMRSIGELPEGYRTILNLYAVEGYSHREVAEQMNISENTSRSQYSRAKVRLAEILKEKGIL
ncbi:MAG: sigma-70 family RNA polymerase sigma factor [Rikenellaceae bacterium]|nr:sigma-70 family RNA polymerase sigma factor [Rikenellaceae bacterium]